MTSSLVGSEMCIRDRGKCVPATAEGEFCPLAKWDVAPVTPQRVATVQKAVSYTHLTLPTICSV
eukprot:4599921-Prorocentrum_lima.AAC.1